MATGKKFGRKENPAQIGFPCAFLFFSLILANLARAGDAPGSDPKAILKQTETIYKNAKTYHGILTLVEAGKDRKGAEFTYKTTQELWYATPNRLLLRITSEGSGSAQKVPHLNLVKASDGKILTVFDGARNQYYHRAALAATNVYHIFERAMPNADAPGLTLLPPADVQGRAAYLVQTALKTPMAPASGPTLEQARKMELLRSAMPPCYAIDKQNSLLLQVTSKAGTVTQTVTLENQQVNAALSSDALIFSLPPGTIQIAPPGSAQPTPPPAAKP